MDGDRERELRALVTGALRNVVMVTEMVARMSSEHPGGMKRYELVRDFVVARITTELLSDLNRKERR